MPIDWRHVLALSLLCLVGCSEAQLVVTASTEASLKVGDYADQLSDGTALPLYILVWRAVGTSFSDPSGVNQTFATDANNAFLAANHSMTYTVANIRNAAVLNTTRKINGTAVPGWSTDSEYVEYSSMDLLMRTTFTQDSVWEDLGVTQQSHRLAVSKILAAQGWNMTAVVPMQIQIASEAAGILQAMPLPSYSSYQVVVQVVGANVIPSSLQKQNLISDTLLTLLASDHVFLVRLMEVDETVLASGQGSATMTYIMQKSSDTVAISTALELVLGQADTPASQARSAFTLALAIYSMTATATVLSETPVDGDSLQDQIDALTAEPSKRNRHLGAIIGSSVGSGVALLLLTAAFVIFGRGWLNKRRLQKQTAAWRKEQKDIEDGKASFHDSGSSLENNAIADGTFTDDPAAAKCWDIDEADIVLCTHPDGRHWLLSSSESGQVYKAIKGGVQDVVVKVLTSTNNLARPDLRQEVEVLKSVSYDRNVVQFYGTCPHGDQTMLVQEYMEGGDLRHALTTSSDGELKWHNKGSTIALDIVRGLHFLHSHGVMHMDLKASNVFLTKTYSIAKIGEVDMAKVMGSTILQRPHAATFAYSAPELILNGSCTEKVDMYSFGVILWELITSEMPRRGRLRAIKVPEECPAEVEHLIDLCLATESTDRPTAKQAFDIISSCSPHPVAPAPPVPPNPKQPMFTPADSRKSWTRAPSVVVQPDYASQEPTASQPAEVDHNSLQSLHTHLQGSGHTLQIPVQEVQAANGTCWSNSALLQHLPMATSGMHQNGTDHLLQARLVHASMQKSNRQWQHGDHSLSWQQHGSAVSSNHDKLAGQAQAIAPAEDHSQQLQGSQGSLPLGVFGHLYPSPFAMAADESSGPLWRWQ